MKKVLFTLFAAFSFCAMAVAQNQNASGKSKEPGAEYIRLNNGTVILISKK